MTRATNSYTPHGGSQEGRRESSLLTFGTFGHSKAREEEKFLYDTYLSEFFSLVRKERKGQKEERIDSRLGDADTHAPHMCQSLF